MTVLEITDDAGVRLLTLNRPEVKNAFNPELYGAVRTTLDETASDDTIKVCVITGAGNVFSAGQDLKVAATLSDNPAAAGAFEPFARALARFDKPLIAAVNGAAVGIGATLLLHCDVVLAADEARFKLPFLSLGFVPEAGSSVLLPMTLGPQAAAFYLLTGDWMDGGEAVERGLVWKHYPPEQLLAETMGIAHRIAAAPVEVLRNTTRLLRAGRSEAVAAAMDRETRHFEAVARRLLAASATA